MTHTWAPLRSLAILSFHFDFLCRASVLCIISRKLMRPVVAALQASSFKSSIGEGPWVIFAWEDFSHRMQELIMPFIVSRQLSDHYIVIQCWELFSYGGSRMLNITLAHAHSLGLLSLSPLSSLSHFYNLGCVRAPLVVMVGRYASSPPHIFLPTQSHSVLSPLFCPPRHYR